MNIDKLISSLNSVGKNEQVMRPEPAKKAVPVQSALVDSARDLLGGGAAAASHSGVDRVEISAEARVLAELQQGEDQTIEPLSDARVADIRASLSRGVYNSPEVADAIARALLERNDL